MRGLRDRQTALRRTVAIFFILGILAGSLMRALATPAIADSAVGKMDLNQAEQLLAASIR